MMRPFVTNLLFKSYSSVEHLGELLFADGSDYYDRVPLHFKQSSMYELINNRCAFKKFCSSNDILTPKYFCSDKFEEISYWAIKNNRFPMVIKSEHNSHDGRSIFLLRAYRELIECFEAIKSEFSAYKIIIEDFIQPRARIELTCFNKKFWSFAQIELEKSIPIFESNRTFPLNVPSSFKKDVSVIVKKFIPLIEMEKVPIRFNFCLTNNNLYLISINAGFNRLSYLDKNSPLNLFQNDEKEKIEGYFRTQMFFSDIPPDANEFKKACGSNLKLFLTDDKTTILLLNASDNKALSAMVKQTNLLIKELTRNDIVIDEKQSDDD